MNLLVTGLSGLVGSKFAELYREQFQFEDLGSSRGIDITDEESVHAAIATSSAPVIVHFAAFTDTAKAFEQEGDLQGQAYRINVIGTRHIVQAAREYKKHVVHISTAYVFDGTKDGKYTEEDTRHPIEWYGKTKTWAEEEVEQSGCDYTILRIDRPYRLDAFPKLDILHKVKQRLEEGSLPPQFTDTRWTPTSIEKFSALLAWVCEHRPHGIFHATTEPEYSDYTFAQWVNEYYRINREVQQGSLEEYLQTHPRPYQKNTALDTKKLLLLMNSTEK